MAELVASLSTGDSQSELESIEFTVAGDVFNVFLIDSEEKVRQAVTQLLSHRSIAVDLEGVNLSRAGTISLIQIAPAEEKEVYLFDITTLKERVFFAGLFRLLTEKTVQKVFFDVRGDCDALFHQYHFVPSPIVDCQIAMMCAPRRRESTYVTGLKKAFKFSKALSLETKDNLELIKEDGLRYFAPECGGTREAWDQRPLSRELLVYASVDVWYLNIIYHEYFRESRLSLAELQKLTKNRIMRVVCSEQELKGPQMAERDF
jgi:exonuclease 3'-5' domain-containing protein 1